MTFCFSCLNLTTIHIRIKLLKYYGVKYALGRQTIQAVLRDITICRTLMKTSDLNIFINGSIIVADYTQVLTFDNLVLQIFGLF